MIYPGGSIDQYAVPARDLNESFIGAHFGLTKGAEVIYGKIDAIRIFETHFLLTLAGVTADDLHLDANQEVIFSHGQHQNQVTRRAPMTESIDAEVARTLSTIPVRASRQMTAVEYQLRVAEILRLFDIDAVADETGVYYGGEGVELEDQPLEAAVRKLIGRRFRIPEALQ
jgi:hypothetical protein